MILVGLIWFAFANSQITTFSKVTSACSTANPEIILIGEIHGPEASNLEAFIRERLVGRDKVNYLLEASNLASVNNIDNFIFRFHAHVSELIRYWKDGDIRSTTIQLANVLYEASFYPKFLQLDALSEEETFVLEILQELSLKMKDRSQTKKHLQRLREVVIDYRKHVQKISLQWLATSSVLAFNHLPAGYPAIPLYASDLHFDDISYADLKDSVLRLDLARELFMAQKILDSACSHADKITVAQMGVAHMSSIKKLLQTAQPTLPVLSYNISLTTWFAYQKLESL